MRLSARPIYRRDQPAAVTAARGVSATRPENGLAATIISSSRNGAGIGSPIYCFSDILQCMKTTVTINSRGVITLPTKLRQALGLKADDHLIAETTPEGLLLRPAVTLPVEVYTPQREREFDAAEAELAAVLARPPAPAGRAARKR
ncbi:MAG: AbrB/MazE/SpoVT family DNA-binding domain-containing protein [Candidatus Methylophosphatis roskildensis]|uniref:AbrB/MazE/SpoVT family DNA-binding domain-containing protein n=1 Tax=Candidatus Methylophosphatis roskildensis TaxID=2899263 RepID=A0A9D7E344_9PROT|nr:AbrB/MazE/SpoVT family DNA-binding domain-containing protein [Candidatus Methylophosphatis roskildensis]MBK7237745.1 AbrB/MazE/SpoVT family DNA-binding domain-containing protein [Sterolibacteriaceae bacterium]